MWLTVAKCILEVISITEEDIDPIGAKQLMETDVYSDDVGVDGQVTVWEAPLVSLSFLFLVPLSMCRSFKSTISLWLP